ncbi:hypothetical protein [Paraburkholderia sp.]|uniref:hypothetical protein n=1 Tax=Paraburkholderia sp. TaxID=1926495 RepID=UPI002D489FF3|nr:hypothetical protein [Paraburkholderia sp.]HZZ04325.1 hypothetical protein [Paraburkholderia sp.]
MIDELSHREGWSSERLADTMTRAVRGPLADLLPNLAHFKERLAVLHAGAAAHTAMQARTWRMDGLDGRRDE